MQFNDAVNTTTASSTDPLTDGVTATTTGVARCELTTAISNGTSTTIHLTFDVVDIEDPDVREAVSNCAILLTVNYNQGLMQVANVKSLQPEVFRGKL